MQRSTARKRTRTAATTAAKKTAKAPRATRTTTKKKAAPAAAAAAPPPAAKRAAEPPAPKPAAIRTLAPRRSAPADSRIGPRRTIFIDVENTSSEAALLSALDHLGVERAEITTEIVAVGNWRVIGQHVARMLAQRGARLLHTAPATGVKDWSDLSIAVAAGIWLGRAEPGDQIEIVSADRAFDAVADAAAALGVKFRRLTYGATASAVAERIPEAEGARPSRRGRRGGRYRRNGAPWSAPAPPASTVGAAIAPPPAPAPARSRPAPPPRPVQPAPAPAAAAATSSNGAEGDVHGATPEQIVATIARLCARDPDRGVNLDLLINALKDEGFGRPPGSPRLVTRLRKMKDVEVSPTGMVRLIGSARGAALAAPPAARASEPPPPRPAASAPAAADDAPAIEGPEGPVAAAQPDAADGDAPRPRSRRRGGGGRGRRRRDSEPTPSAAEGAAPGPSV